MKINSVNYEKYLFGIFFEFSNSVCQTSYKLWNFLATKKNEYYYRYDNDFCRANIS